MDFKKSITVRYCIALALVATVLLGAYATLILRLQQNQDDGLVINRAGQQRMLSQRIALLMREINAASSSEGRALHLLKLKTAIARMQSNHDNLTDGLSAESTSPEMVAMYTRPHGINERLALFLDHGAQFVAVHQSGTLDSPKLEKMADVVAAIARNGFVDELDAVVQEHQRLFEADIARFKVFETFFIVVGLCLLLLEALLIFRPMAHKVEQTVADLEQRNTQLKEFSFRISHDLRAPIASSLGMIAIAEEAIEDDDPEELEFAISRIRGSMKNLDTTIESIVNVTRAGFADAPTESVSLATMVAQVLEKLSAMPGYDAINIRTEIESPGHLVTKKVFLQQIMENLISNAIKYADQQQQRPEIHISAAQVGKTFEIAVADNGVGIPPEYRKDLFGMFKRFHPDQSFGSGLGLYLVRQNATALGGQVSYTPLSPGTQFTLTVDG